MFNKVFFYLLVDFNRRGAQLTLSSGTTDAVATETLRLIPSGRFRRWILLAWLSMFWSTFFTEEATDLLDSTEGI